MMRLMQEQQQQQQQQQQLLLASQQPRLRQQQDQTKALMSLLDKLVNKQLPNSLKIHQYCWYSCRLILKTSLYIVLTIVFVLTRVTTNVFCQRSMFAFQQWHRTFLVPRSPPFVMFYSCSYLIGWWHIRKYFFVQSSSMIFWKICILFRKLQ